MLIDSKMSGEIHHKNVGCFCPQCYTNFAIGDVHVSYSIDLAPTMDHEGIRVNPMASFGGSLPQTIKCPTCHSKFEHVMDGDNFIEVICPDCHTQMIPIDESIRKLLVDFNTNHIFTHASCDGIDSYSCPYITLYNPEIYIMMLFVFGFIRAVDKDEDSGWDAYRYNNNYEQSDNYQGLTLEYTHLEDGSTIGGIYGHSASAMYHDAFAAGVNEILDNIKFYADRILNIQDVELKDALESVGETFEFDGVTHKTEEAIQMMHDFFAKTQQHTLLSYIQSVQG